MLTQEHWGHPTRKEFQQRITDPFWQICGILFRQLTQTRGCKKRANVTGDA